MLIKSATDKIQENVRKPSFCKSLPLGGDWKHESMRMIPEEFVRSTKGAFMHRVVFEVRWGNSWQLYVKRRNEGLFMIKVDWDEFVDDNHLGPDDILSFTHDETMYIQVKIFKKNGKEVISYPMPNSHQDTTTASASASASGNGGTNGQTSQRNKTPEEYLLNPRNPFFVKTLTKKNDVLYVRKPTVNRYGLKFGPPNSAMTYFVRGGKEQGVNKNYSGNICFSGWIELCRKYNLKFGDSVVCELELTEGIVTAVRVHFPDE